MSTLGSIPPEVFNEIYLTLPRSLMHSEMHEALLEDERKRLIAEGFTGDILSYSIDEYKKKLSGLGPISVAEMAYETCIQSDRFDQESNQVWIDRSGKFKVNPSDIYRHNLIDSLLAIAEKVQGASATAREKNLLIGQVDMICVTGKGQVSLGYGELTFSFDAENRQVKHAAGKSEVLSFTQSDVDRVSKSYKQYVDKCIRSGKTNLPNSMGM